MSNDGWEDTLIPQGLIASRCERMYLGCQIKPKGLKITSSSVMYYKSSDIETFISKLEQLLPLLKELEIELLISPKE